MSKGNYYSGSPLGQRMNDDNEWPAVILSIIIGGVFAAVVFSVKSCTDNKEEQTKIEQTIQKSKVQANTIGWGNVVKSR